MEPEWQYNTHPDGTEQYWIGRKIPVVYLIERVNRHNSRRKRWTIVKREDHHGEILYPPKVAGPFPDLDTAKVAYLMLKAALT